MKLCFAHAVDAFYNQISRTLRKANRRWTFSILFSEYKHQRFFYFNAYFFTFEEVEPQNLAGDINSVHNDFLLKDKIIYYIYESFAWCLKAQNISEFSKPLWAVYLILFALSVKRLVNFSAPFLCPSFL